MKSIKEVSPIYLITIFLLLLSITYVIPNIIFEEEITITDPDEDPDPNENPNGDNDTLPITDPDENPDPNENPNGDNGTLPITDPDENPDPNENPNGDNSTLTTNSPLLVVEGKNIVDKNGNITKLSGFFIWTSDILYKPEILEMNLKKIKESGFNTIIIAVKWSYHIEPSESEPGVYDQEKIALLERTIETAQSEGLYVIFGLRTNSSPSTSEPDAYGGWAYADLFSPHYTSNWDEYFSRYLDAWEYMIQRLEKYESIIGYNLWFYPFHGQDPETGLWQQPGHKINHYEEVMTPLFLSMLRNNTEKIYFWTPVDQGSMMTPEILEINENGTMLNELPNDPTSSTGQYLPGYNRSLRSTQKVNRELTPINDSNVVYCAEGHRPINVERKEHTPYNWTGTAYQKQFIDASFKPLWLFTEKYQVPGMISEMGMFNDPEGAEQWRIDAYDYKMQKLNENDIHWVYMWNGREKPVDQNGNWNNVGEMLIRNIPDE